MIKLKIPTLIVLIINFMCLTAFSQEKAKNPIIHADVPDMSIIRVADTYYMSSTTMHMSPGVPIMKSKDLVNWELISYAYETLGDFEDQNLQNGKSMYGRGSWASCMRYVNGIFYVSTFSSTTGKTYIFSTDDPEKGVWKEQSFSPSYHDHTIFFDEDGKIYMIWGAGTLKMVELKEDLSGVKPGTERVLIENASAPAGENIGLNAEGSQLFKVNGKYYLFNIVWPRGGMRTTIVHRADNINGPYEGKVVLQDKGVAQGGIIDTPKGEWFAYLFKDNGAVGRIPYLIPVTWDDGWPVLGENGKVPDELDLPMSKGLIPGIVASDEFNREKGDPVLPLAWQWNHNPDNSKWTVDTKKGCLRLTTGRVDNDILMVRNILTQRTVGPESEGATKIDVKNMKVGDRAGLILLQKNYGWVGVIDEAGKKFIAMNKIQSDTIVEVERIPISQKTIYLKATCDFNIGQDVAWFYYSLDGITWNKIGSELKMYYTLPHFMGYRFGLFNYATANPGGSVDFDYFRINSK
jgi:beta-xylosidase